jgi:hypothetical protein
MLSDLRPNARPRRLCVTTRTGRLSRLTLGASPSSAPRKIYRPDSRGYAPAKADSDAIESRVAADAEHEVECRESDIAKFSHAEKVMAMVDAQYIELTTIPADTYSQPRISVQEAAEINQRAMDAETARLAAIRAERLAALEPIKPAPMGDLEIFGRFLILRPVAVGSSACAWFDQATGIKLAITLEGVKRMGPEVIRKIVSRA